MAIFDGQDMIFDDYNFAKDLYVEYVRRPLMQPLTNQFSQLNRYALHRKTRRGAYYIEVDVRLIERDRRDVTELKRFLAGKLYKEEPCRLYLRGDWRFDMAILDKEIDFERFLRTGFAVLTFLVLGSSYGKFQEPTVTTNVCNTGTDEAWPIITIRPTSTQSRISIENLTTGEKITIDRMIPAGSTVQIGRYNSEMEFEQIVLQDGQSIMGSVWYDAEFPRLKPGENVFDIIGAPSAQLGYWERWL